MIKSIRLVGCQSWKDETLELKNGLNVLVADNSVGKSVLFKMLKITSSPKYFSRKERCSLIRWGCPAAIIVFLFENGSMGITKITKSEVIYGYKEKGEKGFNIQYEPQETYIENLGLVTNADGSFICNLIDTDQDLLLVNSQAKSNYDLLSMLVKSIPLDRLSEHLDLRLQDFATIEIQVASKKQFVDRQLDGLTYVDIAKEEERIKYLENLLDGLESLVRIESYLNVIGEANIPLFNFDELLHKVEVLECLEKIEGLVGKLCVLEWENHEPVLQLLEQLEAVESKLGGLSVQECSDYEPMVQVLECLEKVEELVKNLCIQKWKDQVPVLRLLEQLESIENEVNKWIVSKEKCAQLENEIISLEQQFRTNGSLYECPIYGEVVFDGEECIPCS